MIDKAKKEKLEEIKLKLKEIFNLKDSDFRSYGEDQFIVSIPVVSTNKLELVINCRGEVLRTSNNPTGYSSFRIKNEKNIHNWGDNLPTL